MMQLNCLPLWDKGVADRILNQDILNCPSCGGPLLFAMNSLLTRPGEQPVENIKQENDNKKTQRGHSDTSLFSIAQEVS